MIRRLILVLGLVFGGSVTLAPAVSPAIGATPEAVSAPLGSGTLSGPIEIPSLRTRTSDTVQLPNGTRQTRISAESVNVRQADGSYVPIQNDLIPATPAATAGSAYQNRTNRYLLSLPADLGTAPARVQLGSQWMEFSLVGLHTTSTISGPTATYAFPGGTLALTAENDSVKESISLDSATSPSTIAYTLATSTGLTPHGNSAGSIDVVDGTGALVFSFAPPSMQDAAGVTSSAVTLTLAPSGHTVTLTADRSWLAAPARQFPVVIDPTVTVLAPLRACQIGTNAPDNSSCGGTTFEIENANTTRIRTLFQFDLSAIPATSQVLNADFAAYLSVNLAYPATVDLDAVARAWTSGVTWNTYDGTNAWTTPGGDFNPTPAAQSTVVSTHTTWQHWYPTGLVQSWVNGTADNNGFELVPSPGNTHAVILLFDSVGNSNQSLRPTLTVSYGAPAPSLGTQGFDTFDGPVNVANGNLVLGGTDVGMAGVGLPLSVGRTYNSLSTSSGDLGAGWLLDTGGDVNLQSYGDGSELLNGPSGYQAVFSPDGSGGYTSPPGMDADLTSSGGTFTLTSRSSGTQLRFSSGSGGVPTSMVDASGNTLTYGYTGTQLTSITDTLGTTTSLVYDGNGRLKTITDPTGRLSQYGYDGSGRLTSVTDPMSRITQYGGVDPVWWRPSS